jgi:hypothetical protein
MCVSYCRSIRHPIGAELTGVYAGLSPAVLSRQVLGTARRHFRGDTALTPSERRSSTFHENLQRYVCAFLDIAPGEVFQRCAYTNLVKCSTKGEQDRLHAATMDQCFTKHFIRETEFLRPKVLLALGREVQGFLQRQDVADRHKRPVVYVKHPSYYYRSDREQAELAAIRAEVQVHIEQAAANGS